MQLVPEIAARTDELTAWRHDLHRHPELGFEEVRTAKFVAGRLRGAGFDVTEGVGRTGVVGTLANGAGPAIGLRADMDALPMEEGVDRPWKSQTPGVFHGCGHDGHTVSLLAAAEYLTASRNFSGTVNVIFQPAEEGLGGGKAMVEDGLFDRFRCDAVYGFHNMPLLPFGQGAVRAGAAMASFDEFEVTMIGRGGHAAMPHKTVDPAIALAETAMSLQGVISREVDPHAAAVLSVTQIHVGTTHNVIAERGWLGGTVRALDEAARATTEKAFQRIVRGVAAARGVDVEIDYQRRYPVLINDAGAASRADEAVRDVLGDENIGRTFPPLLAAEDFAFMTQVVPGAYFLLGQGRGPDSPMVHDPAYDFDDALLPVAASCLARLVERQLPAVM
jgi:hippurate hydrolase